MLPRCCAVGELTLMMPLIPQIEYDANQSGITVFNPKARPLFERARRSGNFERLIGSVARYSWQILLLSDCISGEQARIAQTTSAIQPIDLDRIQGSVNRSDDFSRRFNPLSDHLETRWVRIASMMLQGTPLPPVDLVQVGEIYFVADGHHRISVARAFKYTTIDALITAAYLPR